VVLIDALSYAWSALWLRGIRMRERLPERVGTPRLGRDIAVGLGYVFRHPILRPMALNVSTIVLFQSAIGAVTVVFLVRDLGLSPGLIGLLGMSGLVAAVVSSMVTGWVASRVGSARAMLVASVLIGVAFLLLPLTRPGAGLVFYVASGALAAFGIILHGVLQSSARQQLCPRELQGRVGATMNVLSWGMMPLGALLGGVLAGALGLRGTLLLAATMALAGSAWLFCSPLRRMRDVPVS
jgi:predicted MFS family arabinose efflux permease